MQVAERFGVSRERLLALDQLEPEWLRRAEDRLPVERFYEIYRLAARETGQPDLGLYVGRVAHFTGLNLLLYMSTICRSFRDYLNLVPSILRLRGDIGEVVIERDGDYIRLDWCPLQPHTASERFLSDEVLSTSMAIVNTLCIDPILVRKAHFTYDQPENLEALQDTFGGQLLFNQARSSLFFDRQVLNSPVIKLDYELQAELTSALQDLFEEEITSDPFLRSLRQALAHALPRGDTSIDTLATELGVSRRTLQRRLTSRNTHFMEVLQEVRAELATRYLADNRLGITEIAFLLGYSDQASFSAAFRGWYQRSPSEYRESL